MKTTEINYRQSVPTEKIVNWLERIEKAKMPQPIWVKEKQVFEYPKITVETVAFLKTARAVNSFHALPILCNAGLFLDYETILRCIYECCNQVTFLLEGYPNITPAAKKFVEHFTQTTIDEGLDTKTVGITSSKVHSANARMLEAAAFKFEDSKKLLDRSFKALSASAHSSYAAIMTMYGGPHGSYRFNLSGIPSQDIKHTQSEWIDVTSTTLFHTIWLLAMKLEVNDVLLEIKFYRKAHE